MASSKASNQFVDFKLQWKISKEEFRQLVESSKVITRRFWTTHNNVVLEWGVEFTIDASKLFCPVGFRLMYNDGPSENVQFSFSLVGVRADASRIRCINQHKEEKLARGKFVEKEIGWINREFGAYFYQIGLSISASSFDNANVPLCEWESPVARPWMINLHSRVEDAQSKSSDIRLVTGDKVKFYCHRIILTAQSELFDGMFRHPRSEEEKSGTFTLPTLTGDALRKILEYFYNAKIDLESSSSDQLMSVYDFGEQHGLQEFKDVASAHLWIRVLVSPSDCVDVARFAELHGMNQLKLRCFDILADNYTQLGLDIDEMFDDPPENGEQNSSWKVRIEKCKNAGNRLRNEFIKYLCGRIEPAVVIDSEAKA